MKKSNMFKKIISLVMLMLLLFSMPCNVSAQRNSHSKYDLEKIMQDILQWKKSELGFDKNDSLLSDDFITLAGSPSADWYAIALGRMGAEDNFSAYLSLLENYIASKYNEPQKLDSQKATEWHRISLAMLSLGGDPTSSGKNNINLIADGTYYRDRSAPLDAQGINGMIWGLITIDSMSYDIAEDATYTRNQIISEIIKQQNPNGSFSLNNTSGDIDITAMAITALSPYFNSEEEYKINGNMLKVSVVIDKAIKYLSDRQSDNGGFSENNGSEAIAQTIIALCSVGIDPISDQMFNKNNNSLLDALLAYQNSDGGFLHSHNDTAGSSIASEQALLAVISLCRFQNGLRNLYDFRSELSAEEKTKISLVEEKISALSENQQEIEQTFELYCKIPPAERRYVKNYHALADKMQRMGIKNTSVYLSEAMNQNTNGCGTVIDIISQQKASQNNLLFSQSDINSFNALPENLTTENKSTVLYLYNKLKNAENKNDYPQIYKALEADITEIDDIQNKIESLNDKILNELYPFDSISLKDKAIIQNICKEFYSLSEYDQKQILGYEDLIKSEIKLKNMQRTIILKIVAVILLIALFAILLIFIIKRRIEKKEEKNFAKDNPDW